MKKQVGLLALSLLTSCADTTLFDSGGSTPIVDLKNVNYSVYQSDLAECEQYAAQINSGARAASSAVGGAVAGAVIGEILDNRETSSASTSSTSSNGATTTQVITTATTQSPYNAGNLGGVGALAGLIDGLASASDEKETVIRNCLIGRGYRVLN